MGILMVANEGNYTNTDAVANVIRYVTRTRYNEDRKDELLLYGARGVTTSFTPEEMIMQFCYVQELYNITQRGGRRVRHEYFRFSEEEQAVLNGRRNLLMKIAMECCAVFYNSGFQVVYALHYDKKKRLHIHFCVNAINFISGRKFHEEQREFRARERMFNEIVRKYINYIPIQFSDVTKDNFDTDYFDRESNDFFNILYDE